MNDDELRRRYREARDAQRDALKLFVELQRLANRLGRVEKGAVLTLARDFENQWRVLGRSALAVHLSTFAFVWIRRRKFGGSFPRTTIHRPGLGGSTACGVTLFGATERMDHDDVGASDRLPGLVRWVHCRNAACFPLKEEEAEEEDDGQGGLFHMLGYNDD